MLSDRRQPLPLSGTDIPFSPTSCQVAVSLLMSYCLHGIRFEVEFRWHFKRVSGSK